ncbi:hypothetical protein M3Y95_00253300 [Aphelenchoides besseyi]|nr:hypothetical protein M3Y95_00253300 [Aphelenchoides besseyi]
MISWTLSSLVLVFTFRVGFSCIGGASTPRTLAARNRALAATNYDPDLRTAKCNGAEIDVYRAKDLRRLSSLYEMVQSLPVIDGGLSSCEFDSQDENCAWYNQQVGLYGSGFKRAQFASFFDIDKFECTSERNFVFKNLFLLAGGEEIERDQSAAIEMRIPCQLDKALLKFDYWTNNDVPILKVCVIPEESPSPQCEQSTMDRNPLTFEIPQNLKPFRLRIQIESIGRDEIVFLDSVHYDGRFCELMSSSDSTDPSPTTNTVSNFGYELANSINEIPKKKKAFGITNVVSNEDRVSKEYSNGKMNVCEALSCDFNHGDSCFYSLTGLGGTAEWRIGERVLGNPHTGIHKSNPIDQKMTGYAFVGMDNNQFDNEVFVLESPYFSLDEPVYLVFDLYQRSKGPQLKVCINNFDDCPYTSPPISAREFWRPEQRLLLDESAQKIFFIAGKVSRNLYLAIDNIRVQTTLFEDYCSKIL